MRIAEEGVARVPRAIRRRLAGVRGQTNVEIFFDLVYAFAITQISVYLLVHPTIDGALQAALLLVMVWLVWFYTAFMTNWLNPNHPSVRLVLMMLMAASLVMSAGLPDAFGARGLAVAGAYAFMQVGRSVYAVFALRGDRLQRNFERLLVWSVLSSALALAGGFAPGHARELLWLAAVASELFGGAVGIYVPGLGRSTTRDWDIEGAHLAQRTESFVMIALGESIIVIGAGLAGQASTSMSAVVALAVAFAGSVAIWWVYFDRSADAAEHVMATSPDPGRLGRSAYAYIHPVMIGGIIAIASGDAGVLAQPLATTSLATASMLVGGAMLFLIGQALFKFSLWHHVSWARVGGVVVLGLFAVVSTALPALAVGAGAAGIVALVAVTDFIQYRRRDRPARH
jgi:low temperature requirement protein LtrA